MDDGEQLPGSKYLTPQPRGQQLVAVLAFEQLRRHW